VKTIAFVTALLYANHVFLFSFQCVKTLHSRGEYLDAITERVRRSRHAVPTFRHVCEQSFPHAVQCCKIVTLSLRSYLM
jgi:hypothetical protein